MKLKEIYNKLIDRYYDYYCTVYYEIILEAIQNTIEDFKNKKEYTIEEIHQNIIENYI